MSYSEVGANLSGASLQWSHTSNFIQGASEGGRYGKKDVNQNIYTHSQFSVSL